MLHAEQLEKLRKLVRATIAEYQGEELDGLQETILIRDGHYCGRRFRGNNYQAIWFIEENQLKIYGPDGGIVRVMSPDLQNTEAPVEHLLQDAA